MRSYNSFLTANNASQIVSIYRDYIKDPTLIDQSWHEFFSALQPEELAILADYDKLDWSKQSRDKNFDQTSLDQAISDSLRLIMMIRAYREIGHLIANLDPLNLATKNTPSGLDPEYYGFQKKDFNIIARLISAVENYPKENSDTIKLVKENAEKSQTPVLGITGTGGAGKSSLVDELVRRFILDFKNKDIAIISVDPSKRKTGGALLGDRIRMNAIKSNRVYMRSLATRQANLALSAHVNDAINILKVANFDLIILETSGIGQSDTEIIEHSDISLYVMTPEYGAATQLEKIDMLDFADLIAINKFDKKGSLDALRDVQKQYQRNNQRFDEKIEKMPVYGTIASQFNDPGTNTLYQEVMKKFQAKKIGNFNSSYEISDEMSEKIYVIPSQRVRYLSEIAENNRAYDKWVLDQKEIAQKTICIG